MTTGTKTASIFLLTVEFLENFHDKISCNLLLLDFDALKHGSSLPIMCNARSPAPAQLDSIAFTQIAWSQNSELG